MDPTPDDADVDDLPPWELPGAVRRDCEPHRGELLTYLATASVVCAVFGCITWGIGGLVAIGLAVAIYVLASQDLAGMAAGTTDPAGELATRRARKRGLRVIVFSVGVWVLLSTLMLRNALGFHGDAGRHIAVVAVLGLMMLAFAKDYL